MAGGGQRNEKKKAYQVGVGWGACHMLTEAQWENQERNTNVVGKSKNATTCHGKGKGREGMARRRE